MSTGRRLVTVIVAAHNEERHLGECLASLASQTWAPLEVIVADDGSTDGTARIAEAAQGVRLISMPRRGKARTVNAAAAEARGDVLLFLDADMVFEPSYVELLVTPILERGAAGTAHAVERVANSRNRWAACWQLRAGLPPDKRLVLSEAQLAEGSIVFRAVPRADFLRVGGFDDIGYQDDQTLHPKLGKRALWIQDAECRHYNPETLAEVAGSGRWGAQSVAWRHGAGAVWRFLPPLPLLRGIREGLRHRSFAMIAYVAAFEAGMFAGLLSIALRGRRRA